MHLQNTPLRRISPVILVNLDPTFTLTKENKGIIMRVLTVIPTYNEKENLPVVVERLRKAAPDVDILVVDDNSPDGTGQIADTMAEQDSQIHVLHRTVKDGLGGAYLAGFDWGLNEGYEVLIEMDADCSHQPEQLPSLVHAVEAGADLAIGSRRKNRKLAHSTPNSFSWSKYLYAGCSRDCDQRHHSRFPRI